MEAASHGGGHRRQRRRDGGSRSPAGLQPGCPCWHRPIGPLKILAAAEPPPLSRRNGHSEAATRVAACHAVYREFGASPPADLRPKARRFRRVTGRRQAARGSLRVPVRVDAGRFGVAGSRRFRRAWGSPPAIQWAKRHATRRWCHARRPTDQLGALRIVPAHSGIRRRFSPVRCRSDHAPSGDTRRRAAATRSPCPPPQPERAVSGYRSLCRNGALCSLCT